MTAPAPPQAPFQKSSETGNTEKHWLFLHPFIHLNVKKSAALLYNTLNGRLFQYPAASPVYPLLKRLGLKKNCYVIPLDLKKASREITEFVARLKESYCGDLIPQTACTGKPIQFRPDLKMDKTQSEYTLKCRGRILAADEITDYLEELTLYINSDCDQRCGFCKTMHRRFPSCGRFDSVNRELPLSVISGLLEDTLKSPIKSLHILGGNILKYSRLMELSLVLNEHPAATHYYLNYLNVADMAHWLSVIGQSTHNVLHILIPPAIDAIRLPAVIKETETVNRVFHFPVSSEDDFNRAEQLIAEHRLPHVDFHPYYDGENIEFFKENVFISRESIMDSQPIMRNIFINSSYGAFYFKKMTVADNGAVYANLNRGKMGTVPGKSIYDAVKKEIETGESWFGIRQNVGPCKSCPYAALCPPISHLEHTLGRYDTCTIRESLNETFTL